VKYVVIVLLLVLVVGCLGLFAYTQFINQIVLPLPTLTASEGDNLHSIMQMFQAEEELTFEVVRGKTSISGDESENLFDITYTPEELDRLFQILVNLAFNLNAQQADGAFLTQVETNYPTVRNNLYLIGRFVDNLPFGLKINIKLQSNNSNT
jgi:hypothetical protein